MIVPWIAQRIEILMVVGMLFGGILFVLAVFATDLSRILGYPALIAVFFYGRYRIDDLNPGKVDGVSSKLVMCPRIAGATCRSRSFSVLSSS